MLTILSLILYKDMVAPLVEEEGISPFELLGLLALLDTITFVVGYYLGKSL